MNPVVGLFGIFQTIGSVFVKNSAGGGIEVATAPWAILYVAGALLGCYNQSGEPFSICVRNMFSVFGG